MNAEQTMLQRFARTLYEMDTTIKNTICLRFLVDEGGSSLDTLEELLEDATLPELAALFDIEEDYLDENGDVAPVIVDQKRGWLIAAHIAIPRSVDFEENGQVDGYSHGGIYSPTLAYGETMEEALGKLVAQVQARRLDVFNKARKEQDLPELTVEQCEACNFGMEGE